MSEVTFNERFQTMQRWAGPPMADGGVEARKEVETITVILPFLEPLCIIIYSQYVCNRLLFRCDEGLDTAQFIFLLSKIKHSVTSCEYGCEKKLTHKHLGLGNHMVWICAVCLDEPDVDKLLPWDCFVSWVWNGWVYIKKNVSVGALDGAETSTFEN